MNIDQIASAARTVLGLIIGWMTARGYLGTDTAAMITGVVLAAAPIAWGIYENTRKRQIASVAALPGVEKVITTDQKTADAIPSEKVQGLPATLFELKQAIGTPPLVRT